MGGDSVLWLLPFMSHSHRGYCGFTLQTDNWCTSVALWWANGLHRFADAVLCLLTGGCIFRWHPEEHLLMRHKPPSSSSVLNRFRWFNHVFLSAVSIAMVSDVHDLRNETHSISPQEDVQSVCGILQLELHHKDKPQQLNAQRCRGRAENTHKPPAETGRTRG